MEDFIKKIKDEKSLIHFVNSYRDFGALVYITKRDESGDPLRLKVFKDYIVSGDWASHPKNENLQWMMVFVKGVKPQLNKVWVGVYSGKGRNGQKPYKFKLTQISDLIETNSSVFKLSNVKAPQGPCTLKLGGSRPVRVMTRVVGDLDEIYSNEKNTEKSQMVLSRLGQGKFRDDVLKQWDGACAVTGVSTLDVIRASHIKPWKNSDNKERLSIENGIPLIATLDALFDKGLITFQNDGSMLISKKLPKSEFGQLGVPAKLSRLPSKKMQLNLLYHRSHVFKE